MGASAAFAWYYRFAAADAADEAYRPKAISLVMAGGVVAGLLGPQTAKYAVDWLEPVMFAGVYVMVVALFAMVAFITVQALRIPGLSAEERSAGGRPLSADRTATDLHRRYHFIDVRLRCDDVGNVGDAFSDAGLWFQLRRPAQRLFRRTWSAMFLPSFFTGHLITRFGVLPIIATGAFIQIGCALVNLAGIEFMNFFLANVLVGLGWNFTYVGGSSLLTKTYEPAERAKVQASHDFLVYTTTAAGGRIVRGAARQRRLDRG